MASLLTTVRSRIFYGHGIGSDVPFHPERRFPAALAGLHIKLPRIPVLFISSVASEICLLSVDHCPLVPHPHLERLSDAIFYAQNSR
jgi:hypothetical protein